MSISSVGLHGSPIYQRVEQFKHRDDRGGDIQHNGLQSKSTEDAVKRLWRHSPGWSDKNGDGTVNVTYEFRSAPDDKNTRKFGKTGFTPILDNQRKQTRLSLQSIEDVANIKFTRGPKTADSEGHIKIGNYGQKIDSKGYPYKGEHHSTLPTRNQADVNVWFVDTDKEKSVPRAALGNAGRHTITHELGHAMGLSHPGNYNGSGGDKLGESNVSHHEDSQSHSGMSYRGERTGHHNHQKFRSSAPQLDDIAAYQAKYGANYETRKDDTTYGFNSNTDRDFLTVKTPHDKIVAAIWDGGGNDTLDFSGYTQDQQISLREETFSDVGGLKGNVAIAKGAVIENAIGGKGNDLIIGNDVNNELNGGDGNDVIYGGKGGDRLWGGKGADTFVYGSASESFDAGRQDQRSHDEIMDFESGNDKIDVSGMQVHNGGKPFTFKNSPVIESGEAFIDYNPDTHQSTLYARQTDGQVLKVSVNGKLEQSDVVL
ncbi:M10 family metallopeptidase C-terminal domain-containing protein [Pseudomonas rhodesiae]|uniref:M10 family metallopeptidase C-terminal domain-containing protein n=1 Tax=Pseudomonas rhodesiae TaxID=76760 RepID=UPI0032B17162